MGGGRLRELNHMGSLFREEVLTHLSFVFRLLRVVQYTQRIKRSDHVYSGRLQGVKINGNCYKTVTPKRCRGRFQKMVVYEKFQLQGFDCFGSGDAYGRWPLTRGDRRWRFDCILKPP